MSELMVYVLGAATIVGSGVVGGVFFAFSTFVMGALARVPTAEAVRVMQTINVTVLNRLFLGAFFGTALTGLALVAHAFWIGWSGSTVLLAVGGGLYALGTFGVTVAFNVPWNEALAVLDPDDPATAARWDDYLRTWTRWNHVRTVAAIGSACALLAAY